jgi:NTP pyrophosphatase (non-canonical NTP hydrolase)
MMLIDNNTCSVAKLQKSVVNWADSVSKLNDRIPMTACAKMTEEIGELMLAIHSDALGDPGEECADIAILLLDICHMLGIDLVSEVYKKLVKLDGREWEVVKGLLRHIEEDE